MSNWSELLQRQIDRAGGDMPFFVRKCTCTRTFTAIVMKYAKKFRNPRFLEVGCGTATDSIYFSYFYREVYALDNDKDVMEMAKRFNKLLHGNAVIYQKDLRNIDGGYEIIFNHGTYEHFKREEIVEILRKHMERGRYLIFGVPINMEKDWEEFGNEYLTNLNEWKQMVKEAGGRVIETSALDYPNIMGWVTYSPILCKIFQWFGVYKIIVAEKA